MKLIKKENTKILKESPGVLLWFDVATRPSLNR